MNEDDAQLTGRREANATSRLLAEYITKCNVLQERIMRNRAIKVSRIRTSDFDPGMHAAERSYLADLANNLVPALTELARQASQLIEHASLRPAKLTELKLRIAELEPMIRFIELASSLLNV